MQALTSVNASGCLCFFYLQLCILKYLLTDLINSYRITKYYRFCDVHYIKGEKHNEKK